MGRSARCPRHPLPEIRVPALIVIGAQDEAGHTAIANELLPGIPGSRKVVIPDSAEFVNMDQPETFNQVILDFLQAAGLVTAN